MFVMTGVKVEQVVREERVKTFVIIGSQQAVPVAAVESGKLLMKAFLAMLCFVVEGSDHCIVVDATMHFICGSLQVTGGWGESRRVVDVSRICFGHLFGLLPDIFPVDGIVSRLTCGIRVLVVIDAHDACRVLTVRAESRRVILDNLGAEKWIDKCVTNDCGWESIDPRHVSEGKRAGGIDAGREGKAIVCSEQSDSRKQSILLDCEWRAAGRFLSQCVTSTQPSLLVYGLARLILVVRVTGGMQALSSAALLVSALLRSC